MSHHFIFTPGSWFGEGTIQLNMIEEELIFQTTWTVFIKDETGKIQCVQEIQIQGVSENMKNDLFFYDIHPDSFSVEMNNQNIEGIMGTGIIDEKMIAWEFRDNEMNFEGFELYHLQSDGGYSMKAEYVTSDQFRTKINGRIWQKTEQSKGQIEMKTEEDSEDI